MNHNKNIFVVEGMTCSHCENRIKKSVGDLDGVNNVNVDLDSKKVVVEFDGDKLRLETIIETIEDEGYEVSSS